jgi:predicted ferric reductase
VAFEFALVARLKIVAGAFGQDALQQFHKQIGYVSLLFLCAHPVLLLVGGYPAQMLNPAESDMPWMWRWGTISLYLLILLIVLSVGRKLLRINYEWWQLSHQLLAPAVLVLALLHIFAVAGFTSTLPMKSIWLIYAAGVLAITFYHRVLMPLKSWRRPWTVVRNVIEHGHSHTLVLRPVGHSGLVFEPGQFAWLNMGRTPFHREEHPISFSSSAEIESGGEVAFTVKALGNWSSNVVPKIPAGSKVWVDGPYGVFTPDREQGPGFVLLGGGVGITPLYSMCLTLADREDMRPVYLFYGSRDFDDLTFHEELDVLRGRMNLKIVYVLEHAHEGWTGELGMIDAVLLRRYLPKQYRRFQYFVCGPLAMMDEMERILPELEIAPEQIHTERFDIV